MTGTTHSTSKSNAKPGIWAGLFGANVAVIAVLHITGALEGATPYILYALNFVLLIPLFRTAQLSQEQKGAMSPAMRSYNRRFLGFSALYVIVMLGVSGLYDKVPEGSAVLWLLAIAPALAAMGMIWAMIRYLREEVDEYLRYRAVNAAMVGLGFVLVLGTGWGFLETFGLVPHIWAWWVFPAWAMGLGIGTALPERAADGGADIGSEDAA